jgi:hypothetical protein
MKLTGLPFLMACSASWATFDFMLSKRGWKKLTIKPGGKSIELAPRCVSLKGA